MNRRNFIGLASVMALATAGSMPAFVSAPAARTPLERVKSNAYHSGSRGVDMHARNQKRVQKDKVRAKIARASRKRNRRGR